ncbi:hypothetical protein Tco_0248932, partial [Tanacetum coccineum]
ALKKVRSSEVLNYMSLTKLFQKANKASNRALGKRSSEVLNYMSLVIAKSNPDYIEAAPQEFGEAIANLTKRLEKIGISDKPIPQRKQGLIYENQDPSRIFATQISKERK